MLAYIVDPIPCPILRTLLNEGCLPFASGWVSVGELYRCMRFVGLGPVPSSGLVAAAWLAAGRGKRCNLYRLYRCPFDHNADTQILRDRFRPERLERVLSYASGDRLYLSDLRAAHRAQLAAEPGLVGAVLGVTELTAMVRLFGECSDWISRDALTRLYRENRFPVGWRPRQIATLPLLVSMLRFRFGALARRFFHRGEVASA